MVAELEGYKHEMILPAPKPYGPEAIIEEVHKHCTDDTVVATDVGQHQMWTMQFYPFEKPHTLLTSGGLGTMGYGLRSSHRRMYRRERQKNRSLYRRRKLWNELKRDGDGGEPGTSDHYCHFLTMMSSEW